MEVRKGFKQTEVGVVPEDWDVLPFEEYYSFISYGFTNPMPTTESGIYMVTAKDINNGKIQLDTARFTTEEAYRALTAKSRPKKGDLLLTKDGALGRLALVDDTVICINQSVAIIRLNNRAAPEFLKTLLEAPAYQSRMLEDAGGTTIKHIYITIVNKMPLAVPPTLAEQKAIAEALSDADALIEAVEQLLAKKRQIKQGAMSELLTGKKRLPEFDKQQGYKQTEVGIFPEDWDIVPLKNISSMHGRIGWQGLKQTEFTMNPAQPFLITGMNFKDGEIRWDEVYHISNERYEIAKEIQLQIGDVLMTKDGTIGKILYVDHIPHPGKASLNSHLLVFRPLNKKYVPKFLFYQLNSRTFHNHIELEKSGTTFFGITQEAVGKYNAFLPSIPEQTAIAEILSDMDAEITALEGKLVKARQVKAGMMSELLTGKVRLV